jgi:hypothetical protein
MRTPLLAPDATTSFAALTAKTSARRGGKDLLLGGESNDRLNGEGGGITALVVLATIVGPGYDRCPAEVKAELLRSSLRARVGLRGDPRNHAVFSQPGGG